MITVLSRNNRSINSSHIDSAIYNMHDKINSSGYAIMDDTSTMMYPNFYDNSTIFNMIANPLNISTQGNPLL